MPKSTCVSAFYFFDYDLKFIYKIYYIIAKNGDTDAFAHNNEFDQ